MLSIRAEEGRKGCGRGSERGSVPVSFVVEHGIDNHEEFEHTGDEADLACLPLARSRR